MNFIKKILAFIPEYAKKPLLLLLAFNMLAYFLPAFIPLEPKYDFTLPIDLKIPALPVFSYIYILAFAYWVFNYILICRAGKTTCVRFVTAEAMGKAICFLFFLLLPCTFARPSADTLSGAGAWLLKIVYALDEPTRLFPSIHCYASWLCVRPLFSKEFRLIPSFYKAFSLLFTLLICASTLFTHQHVIVDVFAGILLGEIVWFVSGVIFNDKTKDVAGK